MRLLQCNNSNAVQFLHTCVDGSGSLLSNSLVLLLSVSINSLAVSRVSSPLDLFTSGAGRGCTRSVPVVPLKIFSPCGSE